ncbi:MAG: cytochrome b5 [Planctomycetales bacterium]|nr:MAG: cytochrome b5 [Planctomycetales bacterium]
MLETCKQASNEEQLNEPCSNLPSITPAELELCNGQTGKPAWIAFEGYVYDLSASRLWPNGRHMLRIYAGRDLTGLMQDAPHRSEILRRFPCIGRLATLSTKN